MKNILQIFILYFLINISVLANDFVYMKVVELHKDEEIKILVRYASQEKLFKFRWTLYKNEGLVIFKSYNFIVSQNILYLRHANASVRVELKPRGADFYNIPYLLIKFKKFDFKKKKAIFEFYLSDEKGQIKLKYLQKS